MKMTKLEKKILSIILIVLCVGLIGILLRVFIYKPNNSEIIKLEKEISSLSEKVEEAKKAPGLIVSYKEKIKSLIGGNEENSNLLNQVIDVPDILRIVENAAAKSGVEFEEISMNGNASFVKGGLIENEDGTTEEIINTDNFYLLEMKLKSVCNYTKLWDFLKACEDCGFYTTVDHIAIADAKANGERLEGDIQLNFYSIVSGAMAAEASE